MNSPYCRPRPTSRRHGLAIRTERHGRDPTFLIFEWSFTFFSRSGIPEIDSAAIGMSSYDFLAIRAEFCVLNRIAAEAIVEFQRFSMQFSSLDVPSAHFPYS